ncbi:MAG: S1C family serine protease [Planctomycetota bacterium]|jgi:S1-C subfamily serine protease
MGSPRVPAVQATTALAALLLVAVMVGYALGAHLGGPQAVAAAEPRAAAAPRDLSSDERSVVELFERCSQSVVYISPLNEVAVRTSPWSVRTRLAPSGTGSGIVWDSAGHIVTNYHVIARAEGVLVTLADRTTWRAVAVYTHAEKDLAVLKIEAPAEQLRPVDVGSSRELAVGQTVYAIGNPFGLDFTLTHGIVSAIGREIDGYGGRIIQGVVQTDAAINPGNSGGPLLDSAGRLVGVNTMIFSPSGSSAGIGFAVPVDDVRRIVNQLVRDGKVTRPGLGVLIGTDHEIAQLRLNGVPIRSVSEGSAAERAGLVGVRQIANGGFTLGDVILRVGDAPTPDTDRLRNALEAYGVGATVTLTVLRDGETREVDVTLQAID